MPTLQEIGQKAQEAKPSLQTLETLKKNAALEAVADALLMESDTILKENEKDIEAARANQMKEGLVDRLLLTRARIEGMAEGLTQLVALEDPIGEVLSMKKRPNG